MRVMSYELSGGLFSSAVRLFSSVFTLKADARGRKLDGAEAELRVES